jgi:hypothetical protein
MAKQPSPFVALCRLVDTVTTPKKFVGLMNAAAAKVDEVAAAQHGGSATSKASRSAS